MAGHKLKSLVLAAVVTFSMLAGSAALVGSAAAAGNMVSSDTLDVDDDTQAVQALAENATGTLDVTIYGVDADGNQTEVDTGTLDATGNTTDTYEYSSLDPDTYPQYNVTVTGDADAETVEIAKVQVISGGGGFWGDIGGGLGVPGAVVALVLIGGIVAAAIYTGRY